MKDERKNNVDAYPKPSSSDEQLRHQDEFATQKPNETSPVSDTAEDRNTDAGDSERNKNQQKNEE